MGIAFLWRGVRAFAASVLVASVFGLAPVTALAGQVSGSATAAAAGSPGGHLPIVDGVQRFNVGAAHSPALLRRLAGALAGTGRVASPAMPLGVDVAEYEHPNGAAINWTQVASAGYTFAFVKETEGNYYVNPYYAPDLTQAQAAGIHATGYVFAVPNVSDGTRQADYAVSHSSNTALPMALDVEYDPYTGTDHTDECYGLSAAQMVAWITAFDDEVQQMTGQLPIIYTTADWWNTCTGASMAFGADPLWVAAYSVGTPPLPVGWSKWTYWQYTSSAAVPGIAGPVDASYANSALVALLDPGS